MGQAFPESQRVFFAAFGAGIARRGITCAPAPIRLAHLAGAVRALFALASGVEPGPLAGEIIDHSSAAHANRSGRWHRRRSGAATSMRSSYGNMGSFCGLWADDASRVRLLLAGGVELLRWLDAQWAVRFDLEKLCLPVVGRRAPSRTACRPAVRASIRARG